MHGKYVWAKSESDAVFSFPNKSVRFKNLVLCLRFGKAELSFLAPAQLLSVLVLMCDDDNKAQGDKRNEQIIRSICL